MRLLATFLLIGFGCATLVYGKITGKVTDICSLPSVTGPCKGLFEHYFFNTETGACEMFFYGGCEGNQNNFETIAECQRVCQPQDICSLPSDSGPCKANIPRYFFHTLTGTCERFPYGGCLGNANNFKTLEECESACPSTGGGDGECPIVPPGTYGPCVMLCFDDRFCGPGRRCCSNGCGYSCQPVTPKAAINEEKSLAILKSLLHLVSELQE